MVGGCLFKLAGAWIFRQSSSLKAFFLIMRTVAEKRMVLFITPHVDKKHNRRLNSPFLLDKKSFQRVFSSKDKVQIYADQ